MPQPVPLEPGDIATTAMLSMCVGGLVRTWTDSGSRLWSVPAGASLQQAQGRGALGRTLREEKRYREAGMLVEASGTLILQGRVPEQVGAESLQLEGDVVELEPAGDVVGSVVDDVRALLAQAIEHCVASNEFLVVEKGGWDAPAEPFCLFILLPGDGGELTSVVETAPAPHGSELWEPNIVAGKESQSLSAPASPSTLEVAPVVMMDAIRTWGLAPWDLALTFGRR